MPRQHTRAQFAGFKPFLARSNKSLRTKLRRKEGAMPNLRDKTLNHMATLCRIMSILFISSQSFAAPAFFIGVILFAAGAFQLQISRLMAGGTRATWLLPTRTCYRRRHAFLFAALALTSTSSRSIKCSGPSRKRVIRSNRHAPVSSKHRLEVNIACAILPAIAAALYLLCSEAHIYPRILV